jgi:hypothetical protein
MIKQLTLLVYLLLKLASLYCLQLILEKGEMKVKGYTSHVLPNGVFEHAMILVYSEDAR